MKRITQWSDSVPAAIKREAGPLFKRCAHVLPTWCHWLTISYGEIGSGNVASCSAQPEYRQANITIGEGWLGETDEARREAICHEHVHVLLSPMANFLDRLMEMMPEGTGKAVLSKEWEIAVEGVVCDVAAILRDRT